MCLTTTSLIYDIDKPVANAPNGFYKLDLTG